MQKISTQPYKGSRDFYPEDMRLRNYIFNIWKDVCSSYGYKEYDGPFLEDFDLYAAKTGDEIVNNQLYSFTDKGSRKIAIRPEMTPTLARMISARYKTINYPARWFSIPNLWRYESPQRGRLREFFQLNVDILGVKSPEADFEIIKTAVEIMKRVGADESMFELRINDRRFMDDFYKDLDTNKTQKDGLNSALDKKLKISEENFVLMLKENAKLNDDQIEKVQNLIKSPQEILTKYENGGSVGAKSIVKILNLSRKNNIEKFIKFNPTIVRGLDYYTGTVFEQYDLNPDNTRAMFGGGRYDDLTDLFINKKIPATGYGMGDVTFMDFLKSWNLISEFENEIDYLIVRWPTKKESGVDKYYLKSQEAAQKLRGAGNNVITWLDSDTKLSKQLRYADKEDIPNVVIIGGEELKNNTVTIKNMKTGNQKTKSLNELT